MTQNQDRELFHDRFGRPITSNRLEQKLIFPQPFGRSGVTLNAPNKAHYRLGSLAPDVCRYGSQDDPNLIELSQIILRTLRLSQNNNTKPNNDITSIDWDVIQSPHLLARHFHLDRDLVVNAHSMNFSTPSRGQTIHTELRSQSKPVKEFASIYRAMQDHIHSLNRSQAIGFAWHHVQANHLEAVEVMSSTH